LSQVTGAQIRPFTARLPAFARPPACACSSQKVTLGDLRRTTALGKTRSLVLALTVTVTVLRSQECGSSERVLDGVELGLHEVNVSALHFDVVPVAVNLALLFLDQTSLFFKFCGDAPLHLVLLGLLHASAGRPAIMALKITNVIYRT
jgi:hypothetical protein